MTLEPHLDPSVRHDMVFLFDVADGNPNGDPDFDNRPRMDEETGDGLVSDVAIKRKVRDTLPLAAQGSDTAERYGIFVEAGHALNTRLGESKTANGLDKKKNLTEEDRRTARSWLTERYADIRLFGAVLNTGTTKDLGQIYGPVQVTNARSIDPVMPQHHAITRITQTKQEDIDKGESTEMGGKWTVPYGLYRAEIYYSASRGQQTGVDSTDLDMLYRTLTMMFDHDRSSARGTMTARGLYVFSHDSAFGSAPAHTLLQRVKVPQVIDSGVVPRGFGDYSVSVEDDDLPRGVTMTKIVA
ncbi:CRISPR-associated Csd2 family protein [Halopolyspora algeriensis]|uniref:CRISPR-associated Csd2 family protein n=1 Tax=Halopolyspora algeriensis TaxID=1500506 RepID=A0A368VZP3_9ACTN|nr:type I-C CRISPR-associated protein Cas7/Csd2 [Halopolyspora algeriensis]RCW45124.1 CRISPR-associated Csd2 family protein [Halopolyspora algeriensis]TQM53154.1 CRISPR-associated Csd2 family protein [Halopolyspora algeriensis]